MVGWSGWSCPLAAPALGLLKPSAAAPASASKEEAGGAVGAAVEVGAGAFGCWRAARGLGVPAEGAAVEVGAGAFGCWRAAPGLGVPAEGLGVLAEGLTVVVAVGAGVGMAGIAEGGADFVTAVVTDGAATTAAVFLWLKYWMPAMAAAVTTRATRPPMNRAGRKSGARGRAGTSWSGGAGTGVGQALAAGSAEAPTRIIPG
jgi:hypothetical protein